MMYIIDRYRYIDIHTNDKEKSKTIYTVVLFENLPTWFTMTEEDQSRKQTS